MGVKLIYLSVLYGVAGAREKFEDLVVQLIRSERPDAERVRIVRGDGGIDAYDGSLADPAGVDVFQMKFFPEGIGKSQEDQIRKSFATVQDGTAFKAKSWTLCLPVDLSIDEKRWFDLWAAKQCSSGIEIRPIWGATKLEGLLYEEKNRSLKEAFFKEDHLTMIREMHGTFGRVLDLRPRLVDVRSRNSYNFDADFAVVEVELCFEVENVAPQSVANWFVRSRINLPSDVCLTRKTFPMIGSRRSFFPLDNTILPTRSLPTEAIIGLKIRRAEALDAQVRRLLDAAEVTFWAVADNYVGGEITVPLSEKIDWGRLIEGMKQSLRKANVQANY